MSITIHSSRTRTTAGAAALIATGFIAAGLGTAGATAAAPPEHAKATKKAYTAFALQASGLGTRVQGGDLPVGSGPTAHAVLGCTNKVGLNRDNFVGTVDLGGAGTAHAVRSRLWTTKKGGVVSSWSRHTVAKVVLAESPLGSLQLTGIRSQTRAFHNSTGFHTSSSSKVGAITLVPLVGPTQSFSLPTPGQPIVIPGLARISLGDSQAKQGAHGASVYADALRVEILPTDTTIKVAHSRAGIKDGVRSALFSGWSAGLEATALGGVLEVGRNPLSWMPCQGTDGKAKTKSVASLHPDSLVVRAVKNTQMGKQNGRKAWGYERSAVAKLNIGNGALVVDGIVGKATVTRKRSSVSTSSKGTRIGAITVNGETQTVPNSGVLKIPGVAKIEPGVVEKGRAKIHVIGLRVTLLDGTGAVIDLAQAKLRIRNSHR